MRKPEAPNPPEPEKLQKIIAASGIASRREAETWIDAGRVSVNGETAHLGQRAAPTDQIEVDGRRVVTRSKQPPQVLLLNKAGGLVCSRKDPERRGTIFDQLPELPHGRWVTVGRLDMATTGLLLVTNDGDLAHRMMHPSTGLDREYAVRIQGELEEDEIKQLLVGVDVEGERMAFSDIRYYNGSGQNHWYHVVLTEGRNREVRRLFASMERQVSRLKRVRYGPVVLPSWLTVGQWTALQQGDVNKLFRMLSLPRPMQPQGRVKRSRIAKSSCLIPYPSLENAAKK